MRSRKNRRPARAAAWITIALAGVALGSVVSEPLGELQLLQAAGLSFERSSARTSAHGTLVAAAAREDSECRNPGYARAALTTPKVSRSVGVREWSTARCERVACEWICDRQQHREVEVRLGLPARDSTWVEIPADLAPQAGRALYRRAIKLVRDGLPSGSNCEGRAPSALAAAALHELFVEHIDHIAGVVVRRNAHVEVERAQYALRFRPRRDSGATEQFDFVCWRHYIVAPQR